jgi:hypothetical protein
MSKTFWTFLVVGFAVVAAGIALVFVGTQKNHLELKGEILKVRVLALGPAATFVVADFRVKNPSDIQFVVKDVAMTIDPASGDPVTGSITSKADVETLFQYQKLIGPKFNPVLSLKDTVGAGKTGDFMVAARFELSEQGVEARKAIHLKIVDLDGAEEELSLPPTK